MNRSKGKVGYMDHLEGHDKKFKNTPQHEVPKPDQLEGEVGDMDHFKGPDKKFKGVPPHQALEPNQSEGKVDFTNHPKDPDQKIKGSSHQKALEPDQSKEQKNQSKGEVDYMDQLEDPNQKFKGAPQYEALKPGQFKKQMNQPEDKVGYMDQPKDSDQKLKGPPKHEASELDQFKKQKNQPEGDVDHKDHPKGPNQKFKGAPQHEALEPDQSKKPKNKYEGEVDYMDHPKGTDKKFKDAPQHKAPEPDQSKKQMNQSESEVDYMDHPKGPDQNFKDAPQHKALEPDQSKKQKNKYEGEIDYMDHPEGANKKFNELPEHKTPEPDQSKKQTNQSEAKDTPKSDIKIANDKGKQSLQNTESGLGPQKVTAEVEDITNDTGVESISRNIPEKKKSEDSSSHLSATSQEQGKGETVPKKKHFWSNWPVIGHASKASTPKKPEIDIPDKKQQEHIEVKVDTGPTEEVVAAESTPLVTRRDPTVTGASSKALEILKSIVYGGLIESLASLSVITSAASADATTCRTCCFHFIFLPFLFKIILEVHMNIVALAFANLIGGLFVLGHNLEELKSEQVDRYKELLGQTENFILHAFIAILSFIVFGLVPPVVYGFSFRESDDKDFKLAAVAAASLLCITLLSIAKAYIKRPSSYLTYFKTVLYYVSTGAVASLLSYLSGDLVKKLVQKLGWFESASNISLQIPGIGEQQQPIWASH
ncbi:Membrane protein of ER body-like protein, partial [Mucuna pruriens]